MDFNSDFMPQFSLPIQWQADWYFPMLQWDFHFLLWVLLFIFHKLSENCGFCLNEIKIFHFASHYIFRYWWGEIGYFSSSLLYVNSPISIFMNITRNSSGGRGKLTKQFWLFSITCCCSIQSCLCNFKSLLIFLKSMDG